jgi:hypothetical protein
MLVDGYETGDPRADAMLVVMPIANCLVVSMPDDLDADDIVAAWAARSGIEPTEMTVNLVAAHQGGKRYAAMAWLYLPSLWADDAIVALSEGLAAALSDGLSVDQSSVQVLTLIVPPGRVVEGGSVVHW